MLPTGYALYPPYPNPFNPGTTIVLGLSRAAAGDVSVYNVLGQLIRRWSLQGLEAGYHSLYWDGSDRTGQPVATGVYLVRMETNAYHQTRKIMLLR